MGATSGCQKNNIAPGLINHWEMQQRAASIKDAERKEQGTDILAGRAREEGKSLYSHTLLEHK
jgi:hypothetical protein